MSLPYMPLYVSDFEGDTAHLSLEEDGVYNRLMRLCWRSPNCMIPNDPKWIARRMRVTLDHYADIVEPIIEEFFIVTGSGRQAMLTQKRLKIIYDEAVSKHQARVKAGRKGGQKTKALKNNKTDPSNTDSTAESKPTAKAKQPEPEPEPEPDIKKGVSYETPVETGDFDGGGSDAPIKAQSDQPTPAQKTPSPVPTGKAVRLWNEFAERHGWAAVRVPISDTRLSKLRLRLKRESLVTFHEALERASQSAFCCGRISGKPFKLHFDFIIKPDSISKILEGCYDNERFGVNPDGSFASNTQGGRDFGRPQSDQYGDRPQGIAGAAVRVAARVAARERSDHTAGGDSASRGQSTELSGSGKDGAVVIDGVFSETGT